MKYITGAVILALLLTACGEKEEGPTETELLREDAQARGFYVVSALERHDYAIVSFGACEGVFEYDDQGTAILRNINDWDGPEEWERFTIPDPEAESVLKLKRFGYCI